jgi:hypothetical protein
MIGLTESMEWAEAVMWIGIAFAIAAVLIAYIFSDRGPFDG